VIVRCVRCLLSLRFADPGPVPEDVRMMQLSRTPDGLCVHCKATQFLKCTEPLATMLAGKGPQMLLAEPVQRQFAEVMRAGGAQANPDAIDWAMVVENWALDFPKVAKR
jgi:hypothetical protein